MPRQVLFKETVENPAARMRMTCLHTPPCLPPQRAETWAPFPQLPLKIPVPNRPNTSHAESLTWLNVSWGGTLLACAARPWALASP